MEHSPELTHAFESLKEEAMRLTQAVNNKTAAILLLEKELNKHKIKFPFTYLIKEEGPNRTYLSWDKVSDNYRLYLIKAYTEKHQIKCPLLGAKLADRLDSLNYLDSFLKAFTDYLKDSMVKITNSDLNFEQK